MTRLHKLFIRLLGQKCLGMKHTYVEYSSHTTARRQRFDHDSVHIIIYNMTFGLKVDWVNDYSMERRLGTTGK